MGLFDRIIGRPAAVRAERAVRARGALDAVAREWAAAGLDPRDPVIEAIMRPMLERRLAENGSLKGYREAGVDPWDVLCAAFDALDAEEGA